MYSCANDTKLQVSKYMSTLHTWSRQLMMMMMIMMIMILLMMMMMIWEIWWFDDDMIMLRTIRRRHCVDDDALGMKAFDEIESAIYRCATSAFPPSCMCAGACCWPCVSVLWLRLALLHAPSFVQAFLPCHAMETLRFKIGSRTNAPPQTWTFGIWCCQLLGDNITSILKKELQTTVSYVAGG